MKPTIISDTLHRVIVVQAEVQDQALNAANAHLLESGEGDDWVQCDCQLQVCRWPTRHYRVEFRPVVEGREAVAYAERAERWVPA